MTGKKVVVLVFYVIGVLMAITSLALSFTGLPGSYDTEPVLAIGILFIAAAGIASVTD